MSSSKIGKGALAASAAGLLIAGGGAIAYAATGDSSPARTATTSTASPSTSSDLPSLNNGQGGASANTPNQQGQAPQEGGLGRGGMGPGGGGMGPGGHSHTAVTGDELTKVKDAIAAKDSAVTVTQVMKDEDGSYDAFGTKDGQMVRVEVSADLKTVTVGEGGLGRGGMGPGGHSHTAVTGDELTKVKDAIAAKDSAVTATQVMKDEDGSYDAFGTKDGQMVRVEVSADLKTVTVSEGGPGRGGGKGGGMGGHHGGGMGMPGQAPDDSGQSGPSGGSGTLPVPSPTASTSNTALT